MSYEHKYKKYKSKYLKLLGTCPKDMQICDIDTKDYGLCKPNELLCNDIGVAGVIPNINVDNEIGSVYGYEATHLHEFCGDTGIDYEIANDKYDDMPNKFSIVTYNIWGLIKNRDKERYFKFLLKTMEIRMKAIAKIILKANADIVCLQEVTDEALEFLKPLLVTRYPYYYEEHLNTKKNAIARKRQVEVYVFTKYRPQSVKIYHVTGNLGYYNSFMMIEYPNLMITNLYVQAGSKYSPGQEPYWIHYSRCRSQEYHAIGEIIKQNKKPFIMTGDFNTHLGGKIRDWPELQKLKEMNLNDAWMELSKKKGLTEDTNKNHMRWNLKFQEKKFRYDGILYRDLQPMNIKILGTKSIVLDDTDSKEFYELFIPNVPNKEELTKYHDKENKRLALWPSDHFAVFAEFSFK
jgi:endonuclease/exonuclease/phosphatase family metal-dependent hydrolase